MENNRIKNTKRNTEWAFLYKIASMLLPFITRTVLIYTLGIQYVGVNGLVSSILQVLSLADLGFSSAIVYSMYKPIATGDTETVCELLGFYKKIYRIIGFVILGIGLALVPFLDMLISGDYPSDINIAIVYLVYLINTVLSYLLFAYKKSLLTALQRNDYISKVGTLNKLLTTVLQIAILFVSRKYYGYILVLPLVTVFDNIICSMITKKYYPEYICKNGLDKGIRNDLVEKTKGLLIHKICGVTRNSCDNIFISMFLGITPVGIYSNYYYIMSSVRGLLDVVTTSMSASVGNSVATESVEKNYHNLNTFTFIFQWMSGWCTVCLLCLYQPFMLLWVGEDNMFDIRVVIGIAIYFYLWTIGDIKSQYTDAAGLWWLDRFRTIAEAILNVVLNWALVQVWGIFGVVIATAFSLLIGFPWGTFIVFKGYFKGKSAIRYLLQICFYAAITIIACTVTYFATISIAFNGFGGLILKGLICILLPNLIYLAAFCKLKEFKDAIPFIKKIVTKG